MRHHGFVTRRLSSSGDSCGWPRRGLGRAAGGGVRAGTGVPGDAVPAAPTRRPPTYGGGGGAPERHAAEGAAVPRRAAAAATSNVLHRQRQLTVPCAVCSTMFVSCSVPVPSVCRDHAAGQPPSPLLLSAGVVFALILVS